MTLLVTLSLLFVAYGFVHEAPGQPCINTNFPNDATDDNTYDYIFVGAGATSSVTAAYLALNSSCSIKILVIEAGRDYSKPMVSPEDCGGDIDCFLKNVENDYHRLPSTFPSQTLSTRSSWPFINRPQYHSNSQEYNDGRTTDCPYDRADFIPPSCACISDINNQFGILCSTSTACLDDNMDNTTLCGKSICFDPPVCAINRTNLYWRSTSKGGSSAHHAMFTYATPPNIAAEYVAATGDSSYAWEEWFEALKYMDNDFLHLSYVSNPQGLISTITNDTFKALLQKASVQSEQCNDLSTGANRITNSDEFFTSATANKYFKGHVSDQNLARQVNQVNGTRAFPNIILTRAMDTCTETLTVLCKSFVTKLLFDDDIPNGRVSRRAIGVEYIEGGDAFELDMNYNATWTQERLQNPIKAYARKGVIIGTGVFQSPQLLALSGIGKQTEIEQNNLLMRKYLPAVGDNLEDDNENSLHWYITATGDPLAANNAIDPTFGSRPYWIPDFIKRFWGYNASSFNATTGVPIANAYAFNTMCNAGAVAYGGRACPTVPNSNFTIADDPAYLSYFLKDGKSIYGDAGFASSTTITFYRNEEEREVRQYPTCYAICAPGYTVKGWYTALGNYGANSGSMLICDVLTTALKSRGTVSLKSANIFEPMNIDTNMFSEVDDIQHTADCINGMRRIMDKFNEISTANPSMYGNMQATPVTDIPYLNLPNSVPKTGVANEEMVTFIKESLWHHHPTNTARAGNINDPTSVTDANGAVWGTSNLYIVDQANHAVHPEYFPSSTALTLGFIRAKKYLRLNSAANQQVCDPNTFVGVSGIEQFDQSANPLDGTVTGLSVGLAVAGGALILVSILYITNMYRGSPRAAGYRPVNRKIK